jgi:hypothetical protein
MTLTMTQDVIELCNNCYARFWAFEEPVLFCIVCGDWHGYSLAVGWVKVK